VNLDRSGRVKADTLEFFATKPGWHSPSDLRVDPVLGAIYPRFPDNKSIQMRLMRYSRLGILKRRKGRQKVLLQHHTSWEETPRVLLGETGILGSGKCNH